MLKQATAFSSFSVDDMDEARKFYGQTLGLELSESEGMLTLHLARGGKIMIYQKNNHQPATFTILNFEVSQIDKTVDELTKKGVKFEHYEGMPQDAKGIARGRGPAIAWFTDPAKNILAVMEKP